MACSAAKNVKFAWLLRSFKTFQEPQEPGSKCSCNHPAEMIWDLLCLGCGEDRKAYPFFKLLDLNLQDKLAYRFHVFQARAGIHGWSGHPGYTRDSKKASPLDTWLLGSVPLQPPKVQIYTEPYWTFRNCWHGQFSRIQSPSYSVLRNHVQCIAEPPQPEWAWYLPWPEMSPELPDPPGPHGPGQAGVIDSDIEISGCPNSQPTYL